MFLKVEPHHSGESTDRKLQQNLDRTVNALAGSTFDKKKKEEKKERKKEKKMFLVYYISSLRTGVLGLKTAYRIRMGRKVFVGMYSF